MVWCHARLGIELFDGLGGNLWRIQYEGVSLELHLLTHESFALTNVVFSEQKLPVEV